MDSWHRHTGVYGICSNKGKMLVIHKSRGPYSGRYDLPGGSIEKNESILQALHREFDEETGIRIRVIRNIGTRDYLVPCRRMEFEHTHCHHIAIFYEVLYVDGDLKYPLLLEDSSGAEWIEIEKINQENSSPLVFDAVNWIQSKEIGLEQKIYI